MPVESRMRMDAAFSVWNRQQDNKTESPEPGSVPAIFAFFVADESEKVKIVYNYAVYSYLFFSIKNINI